MLSEMIVANNSAVKVIRDSGEIYADPTSLFKLRHDAAERKPAARLFVDRLCYNYEINHSFYDICDFIYVIRDGEGALGHLIDSGRYRPAAALRYYSYRLRRLCEMAKKTPRKLVVSWDQLIDKSAFPAIKKFLGFKELTSMYRPEDEYQQIHAGIISQGRKCYSRHMKFLRSLTTSIATKDCHAARSVPSDEPSNCRIP